MGFPEGWQEHRLEDICEYLGRGQQPKYSSVVTDLRAINQRCVRDGRVAVDCARSVDLTQSPKGKAVLRSADICVNSTGTGTIGRVGIWRDTHASVRYFADSHVTIVRLADGLGDPVYVASLISSPVVQKAIEIECYSGSTNQVELSRAALAKLSIVLPPLPEQRKIAAILSSVDEAIEKTQVVIDRAQVVKKGLMQELLTKGLPGRHKTFKQTEIGRIPESWKNVSIGDVATVRNGTTPSKLRPDYWLNGDIPWLPTGKVNDRIVCSADTFVTQQALQETSLRLLPKGAVLVAMIGQGKTRGKAAYLAFEASINQNFAGIVPNPTLLDGWFLFVLLEYHYERLRGSGRGSNQDAMNCRIVREYGIPLPPLEEQVEIGSIFREFERKLFSNKVSVERLGNLKSALMSVLLTGELRVRPDPEPTSPT